MVKMGIKVNQALLGIQASLDQCRPLKSITAEIARPANEDLPALVVPQENMDHQDNQDDRAKTVRLQPLESPDHKGLLEMLERQELQDLREHLASPVLLGRKDLLDQKELQEPLGRRDQRVQMEKLLRLGAKGHRAPQERQEKLEIPDHLESRDHLVYQARWAVMRSIVHVHREMEKFDCVECEHAKRYLLC